MASKSPSAFDKVWFVTGCSTGFGRVLIETLAEQGTPVVATLRQPGLLDDWLDKYHDHVMVCPMDVTHQEQIDLAVDDALDRFGRIDVVVNNAGYGLIGAVEEPNVYQVKKQFDVNVFGVWNVLRSVLPAMRDQQSGHILNISSIGGLRAFAGFGWYNASKFALEGMSEALAQELEPLGIHVTLIEPGPFRTDWAGRSMDHARPHIDDYDSTSGETRRRIADLNGKQVGSPAKAADAMIQMVEEANPPLRLLLGAQALERAREKLADMTAEFVKWADLTNSADYTDDELADLEDQERLARQPVPDDKDDFVDDDDDYDDDGEQYDD